MALAKLEREMAARGEGCLGKAADDEPVFVLRAKDRFAPVMVAAWAARVESAALATGTVTPERNQKIAEARELAARMVEWQARNGCKTPD